MTILQSFPRNFIYELCTTERNIFELKIVLCRTRANIIRNFRNNEGAINYILSDPQTDKTIYQTAPRRARYSKSFWVHHNWDFMSIWGLFREY